MQSTRSIAVVVIPSLFVVIRMRTADVGSQLQTKVALRAIEHGMGRFLVCDSFNQPALYCVLRMLPFLMVVAKSGVIAVDDTAS